MLLLCAKVTVHFFVDMTDDVQGNQLITNLYPTYEVTVIVDLFSGGSRDRTFKLILKKF